MLCVCVYYAYAVVAVFRVLWLFYDDDERPETFTTIICIITLTHTQQHTYVHTQLG